MDDLSRSTAHLSLGDSTERTSPRIAVPDDVAYSILLQLDHRDLSTVPTILTCRLVSRSFDAAAQSASVWRPLLQRWTTGEPEYIKLPNASDQSLMDVAIDPLDPLIHPRDVFRARTLIDRVALAAAARRGDSVEEKDRIESYDTIVMLGTQVYDAIIRLKTVSPEERHDYLSIRRVAHELEPSLTRGISMELWRDAFDDQKSSRVTFDAVGKSLAPFGTPWMTFDEIEWKLHRLAHYCFQNICVDQVTPYAQQGAFTRPHLAAESTWASLDRLGYKVVPQDEITEETTYPSASCHLSALLNVASFRELEASNPTARLIPPSSAAFMLSAVLERLPAPFSMKTRLHLEALPRVAVAEKHDPPGHKRWFHLFSSSGGVREQVDIESECEGKSEQLRKAILEPSLPSDLCGAMAIMFLKSGDLNPDGDRTILASSIISLTLASLPPVVKLVRLDAEEEPDYFFSLDQFLTAVCRVYPNDAFLVRKHFHALLSAPKHLRDFDDTFEELLPIRKSGKTILFDCQSLSMPRHEFKGLLDFKVGEACIVRSGSGDEEFGVVLGWCTAPKEGDHIDGTASLKEQKSQLHYHILTSTAVEFDAQPEELFRLRPADRRGWRAARKAIERKGILGEWFSSLSTLEYPTYLKTKAWAAVYPED